MMIRVKLVIISTNGGQEAEAGQQQQGLDRQRPLGAAAGCRRTGHGWHGLGQGQLRQQDQQQQQDARHVSDGR
jgi:hypothetical protein